MIITTSVLRTFTDMEEKVSPPNISAVPIQKHSKPSTRNMNGTLKSSRTLLIGETKRIREHSLIGWADARVTRNWRTGATSLGLTSTKTEGVVFSSLISTTPLSKPLNLSTLSKIGGFMKDK